MKKKNTIILFLFALFYFSPQITEAAEVETIQGEIEEKDELNEERELETNESEVADEKQDFTESEKVDSEEYEEEQEKKPVRKKQNDSKSEDLNKESLKEENVKNTIESKTTQNYYVKKQVGDKNEKVLEKGLKDQKVAQLKKDLKKLGFPVPGKNSTIFGHNTEKKVKEFRAHYGLEVNGVADKTTLTKISEVLLTPLQNGKRHQDTVQLKKDLAALGFHVPGKGTTLYGKDTAKKVREFQTHYGLSASGIAEKVTLNKIQELLVAPLSNGMYREDVKKLKSDLGKLGFPVIGKGTTLFGPKTEKKVKEFQKYYGLKVTGVVDETTLAKIDNVLSGPLQYGKRHVDTIQLKKDLAFLGYIVRGKAQIIMGKEQLKQ